MLCCPALPSSTYLWTREAHCAHLCHPDILQAGQYISAARVRGRAIGLAKVHVNPPIIPADVQVLVPYHLTDAIAVRATRYRQICAWACNNIYTRVMGCDSSLKSMSTTSKYVSKINGQRVLVLALTS